MLQTEVRDARPDRLIPQTIARFAPILLLFGLGIATRLPFQAELVQEWDAGNFALAVENYNLQLEQPHRPGTFLIYVSLARCLNMVLDNPTASLTMVSVIASGIAAAALYTIGTLWFNARVGWATALLMLASPLVWFYGEMPLSYMPEFCTVTLIVLAAYFTGLGERTALPFLGMLMGLAGGIRPNTPIFLLPLALFAVVRGLQTRRFKVPHVLAAVAIGVAALAVWLIPLLIIAGGPVTYWEMIQGWMRGHVDDATTLIEVLDNVIFFLKTVVFVVGVAALPMLGLFWQNGSAFIRRLNRDWRCQAIALWLFPGVMYFTFVHLQRQGHTFTVMPAFLLLAGLAIVGLGDRLEKQYRHAGLLVVAAIVSVNALFFLLAPSSIRSLHSIQAFDTKFTERIEFVRANFPPESTAVLAQKHYGRLPDVHLPEFQFRHLSRLVERQPIVLPKQVRTLVLLDNKIYRKPGQDEGFEKLSLPSGSTIRYRTWSENQHLEVTKFTSKLVPGQPTQPDSPS
ncbi:ArnT family glycosyltransferase [Pantanalinema rosaneae CENA516]|uniref:ArnT family glycosyltransferase n=1 Tax=Pantanalinema rosaneae TaxID=1620701 RepID=UPI003D6E79B8